MNQGLIASVVKIKGTQGFWLSPTCRIYTFGIDSSHADFIQDHLSLFGLSTDDVEKLNWTSYDDITRGVIERALSNGWVRASVTDGILSLSLVNSPSLKKRLSDVALHLLSEGFPSQFLTYVETMQGSRCSSTTFPLIDLLTDKDLALYNSSNKGYDGLNTKQRLADIIVSAQQEFLVNLERGEACFLDYTPPYPDYLEDKVVKDIGEV